MYTNQSIRLYYLVYFNTTFSCELADSLNKSFNLALDWKQVKKIHLFDNNCKSCDPPDNRLSPPLLKKQSDTHLGTEQSGLLFSVFKLS